MRAILLILCSSAAVSATECQTFLRSRVKVRHATPAFIAGGHHYSALRYQVQPHIEYQGVQTYNMQRDPDFVEFMKLYSQYQAFKAGKESVQQLEAAQQADPVTKHCGECHSGANPEKGFLLDSSFGFHPGQITKSLRRIGVPHGQEGHMPPNKQLSAEELRELRTYLLTNERPEDAER